MSRIRFEDTTPINKVNLNKLNNVVISATAPTTGEEVWIQKGKNLFNDDFIITLNNLSNDNGVFTQINVDTNPVPYFKLASYLNSNFVTNLQTISYEKLSKGSLSLTFVKDHTFNEIVFGFNGSSIDTTIHVNVTSLKNGETYTLSVYLLDKTQGSLSWKDIQIEKGSNATEYEPYADKKIFVKNDNGVYEEFYIDKEEVLYENPSGTQELIKLKDIVTNYKYIEIFYEFNNKHNSSTKVYNAFNHFVPLKVQQLSNDQNYYINEYMCEVYMWEGEISFEKARNISFTTTGIKEISSTNNIKITKVVGYK